MEQNNVKILLHFFCYCADFHKMYTGKYAVVRKEDIRYFDSLKKRVFQKNNPPYPFHSIGFQKEGFFSGTRLPGDMLFLGRVVQPLSRKGKLQQKMPIFTKLLLSQRLGKKPGNSEGPRQQNCSFFWNAKGFFFWNTLNFVHLKTKLLWRNPAEKDRKASILAFHFVCGPGRPPRQKKTT